MENPDAQRALSITQYTLQQYGRRILFHDPVLSLKAIGKVSFKDLLLDSDFSTEDLARFKILWQKRLGIGLLWWKDATLEALAMSGGDERQATANAANIGDPSKVPFLVTNYMPILIIVSAENRFPMVGGWIYNISHKRPVSNEAWWVSWPRFYLPPLSDGLFKHILEPLDPPADV
jgi:hypothetical protein